MLEPLRAWLNGSKDYYTGVALYEQLGSNAALLNLLKKGKSDYNQKRLHEELLTICKELKSKQNDLYLHPGVSTGSTISTISRFESNLHQKRLSTAGTPEGGIRSSASKIDDNGRNENGVQRTSSATEKQPANLELYDATKLQADKLYKQTMNDRAVLFSMANTDSYQEMNTEAQINARAKLALSVVMNFQGASAEYDKSLYVKEHGRLPDQDDKQEENEYDHLPEHLVKQTLDNLRKNLNKMKKREQSPERVALQQKHEKNIQKLANRWLSLKP